MWYAIIILVILIAVYIISIYLNNKVKTPEGVEPPEQCSACHSTSCFIKTNNVEKIKQEMLDEIRKQENCDERH